MKRLDLEHHLRTHGCFLAREGGNHPIWKNPPMAKLLQSRDIARSKKAQFARFADNLKFPSHSPLGVAPLQLCVRAQRRVACT